MSLATSLATYVEAQTAITNIIGTKFFPQIVKGGQTPPYAVYSRSSVQRNPHSGGSSGLVTTVVRIICVDNEYVDAQTLADKFRLALDGKTGTVGDQKFSNCTLTDESDNIEPIEFANNSPPHWVALEFTITHKEAVPSF